MKKYLPLVASLFSLILLVTFAVTVEGGVRSKLSADITSLITGGDLASADSVQNPSDGSTVSSDGVVPSTTSTLANALGQLQNKIQFLDDQVARLEVARLKILFTRVLRRGDSGKDVSALQEVLAEMPEIYPDGTDLSTTVTGYYGVLTEGAVKKFQDQNDLKKTGFFDEPTREKIYDAAGSFVVGEDGSSTKSALSLIAHLPNFTDTQNELTQLSSDSSSTQAAIADIQNQIAQIFSRLSDTETTVGNLQNQMAQIMNSVAGAYQVDTVLAPITLTISNIQTASTTKSSSVITWITNISASGEVDYSTNSSLPINQVMLVKDSALITSHRLVLQNLSSGTKYYFRILSKDASGDVATSSIQSFTTAN